jgi:peptide/nickel transport system substrate-binding protein
VVPLLEKFITEFHRIRDGIQYTKPFRLSYLRKVFSLVGNGEKIALIILALLMLTTGSWSARSAYFALTKAVPGAGGEYKEGVLGQPHYLNPIFAANDADKSVVQLVFSGLYHYNSDGALIPDLADSMPVISEDEKEYTVTLKKEVKWHNGERFTADDVVFTITSIQNPETKSPLRDQWLNTEIVKIDDYTVVFKNSDVSGPFIQNLTQSIIQQKLWAEIPANETATNENNLKPVGTGAYSLTEIAQQTNGKIVSIDLKKFDDYFAGPAYIEKITLRFYDNYQDLVTAFHSNEVQGAGIAAIDTNASLSAKTDASTVYAIPLAQYQAIFFNLENKILADKNVRKALALATDKEELINDTLKGRAFPVSGPFIIQHLRLPDNQQRDDSAAAGALLDQAGWKLNSSTGLRTKNGEPLKFTINTNDTSSNTRVAEYLAEEWRELGIEISISSTQTKELTTNVIRPRTFEVLVFAQQLGADPDPFAFWHSSQTKDPGLNITGFNNSQADKLISLARTSTDNKFRQEQYLAFANILSEEVPAIFLNQSVYLYTVDKSIKGINIGVLYDPIYRFSEFNKWYIEESRTWK